ncbi:hypothetical protein CJ739_3622 [Mariniflexile rhizosphaerae]|uniref:hypothetical protein n=1 Tax=unclassified Mariniflexile TaxID=2643887 RepID=UPI000CAC678A|nr:hypothetical protein [Mariniflexile sp. TRM1-10]AXP82684.1 hypothetical protein CJ739_3622 [Mariniflexile sp. TRM1-10]PLB18912.1 MAG: hypothetical protein TRG1_2266 [Flavobacteriaceae bacterium FS1-H7996/R]
MELILKDVTFTGDILNQIKIAVANERTTVKDLIAARVEAEVEAYNNKLPEYFNGLIQPTNAEKTLNGFKLRDRKQKIDVEKQVLIAYDAFQKNGYFILIDDQQAGDLEQEVLVNKNTEINFVKLTQLVGG